MCCSNEIPGDMKKLGKMKTSRGKSQNERYKASVKESCIQLATSTVIANTTLALI